MHIVFPLFTSKANKPACCTLKFISANIGIISANFLLNKKIFEEVCLLVYSESKIILFLIAKKSINLLTKTKRTSTREVKTIVTKFILSQLINMKKIWLKNLPWKTKLKKKKLYLMRNHLIKKDLLLIY